MFSLSKIKKLSSFLLKKLETLSAALRNYEKLYETQLVEKVDFVPYVFCHKNYSAIQEIIWTIYLVKKYNIEQISIC